MCSNYRPVTHSDRLLSFFGVVRPPHETPLEAYPSYLAPFIRRDRHSVEHRREVQDGRFGLIPHWSKDLALGRRTYNARSETVEEKPSFRDAWRRGQRCIVPVEWIYEPCYETGRAVRWRIGLRGWTAFGIAGLWGWWRDPATGHEVLSFTMLTVNADDHPLMRRFHKPGDEKRMVVILDPADYDRWLDCPVEEARAFLRQYPAELMEAAPAPLTLRKTPSP
ncbi:MAG: SOS response-associated peptidase [Caldimonas sp.]|uniref:SOS response-associated peptidase n=1 Tax=Caldimonas sp. TaxID=2838790 RepID=UPI00391B07FB